MQDGGRKIEVDEFTLLSGIAGVVLITLFAISNFALGGIDPPHPSASAKEVADFFTAHATAEQWGVGMRFLIFFLLPPFLYGVARHVRGEAGITAILPAIALMATVWLVATGTLANMLESALIFERERLASEPELARLMNIAMNGAYNAAILPHALAILCLSEAGRRTRTLPIWLVGIGYLQVATGIPGAVLLPQTLKVGTLFDLTFGLSFFAFALWYLFAGLVLIVVSWREGRGVYAVRKGAVVA